jgi:heat shock protein HslJ
MHRTLSSVTALPLLAALAACAAPADQAPAAATQLAPAVETAATLPTEAPVSATAAVAATEPMTDTAGTGEQALSGKWMWIGTQMSNDSTVEPHDPASYTLEFLPDGTLAVQANCNSGRGTYASGAAGELTITPIALTRMACAEPSQDTAFAEQLELVYAHLMDGPTLVLDLKMDTGQMRFSPAEE